jgi:predicted Fe-Mo cluster-binding NifX family protein
VTLEVKVVKEREYTFCMTQFKPAIAVMAVLVVLVLGWTAWHCTQNRARSMHLPFMGGATRAAAALQPTASPIRVKDKMIHPYWGNCSKCHVTIDAGKPVSKVMAGAPISIIDKMPHKYWGNCLLCHKVIDGLQPRNNTVQAKAAAMNRLTAASLGLKVQTVTAAMMRQFGLANEDGVLVLDVAPGSVADRSGLAKGDEIIRAGKTRVENSGDFDTAIGGVKPGSQVKINMYRGKKSQNLIMMIPETVDGALTPAAATAPMTQNQIETLAEQLRVPKTEQAVTQALQKQKQRLAAPTAPAALAAANAPMTQNQIETLAEQLGVPKTEQAVTQALQEQKQGTAVANLYSGKVAVAAMGPGLGYQVSPQFSESPYFIVFDPQQNSYRVAINPHANDATGRGVQTGQHMVDIGASSAVAGSFSRDALNTLHTLRVNAYAGVTGSVQDALSSIMTGRLIPLNTNPNQRAAFPQANVSPRAGVPVGQPIY